MGLRPLIQLLSAPASCRTGGIWDEADVGASPDMLLMVDVEASVLLKPASPYSPFAWSFCKLQLPPHLPPPHPCHPLRLRTQYNWGGAPVSLLLLPYLQVIVGLVVMDFGKHCFAPGRLYLPIEPGMI